MVEAIDAQDLRQLPLRALVALAARCARRVQPLFDLPKDQTGRPGHLRVVDYAIEIAERFAAGDETVSPACAYSAATAFQTVYSVTPIASSARLAASSAAAAAYAASTAYSAEGVAREVAKSALNAVTASCVVPPALEAARVDLRRLNRLHLGTFPDLGDPVDFSARGTLGPLWPKRMPDWYVASLCEPPADGMKGPNNRPRTPSFG